MPRTFFAPAHADCIHTRKFGVRVDRIVVHTIEGSFSGCLSWFQQGSPPRPVATAAHYVVSRAGDVCQMVPDDKKCYHAGNFNSRSIGIEHEARISPWAVRPGKAPPFPVNDFPPEMLDASARVVAALCKKYDIPATRKNIVGHAEVPGATHTDPGAEWPWDDYMRRVVAHLLAG